MSTITRPRRVLSNEELDAALITAEHVQLSLGGDAKLLIDLSFKLINTGSISDCLICDGTPVPIVQIPDYGNKHAVLLQLDDYRLIVQLHKNGNRLESITLYAVAA